jgi:hypothetical protein
MWPNSTAFSGEHTLNGPAGATSVTPTPTRASGYSQTDDSPDGIYSILSVLFAGLALVVAIISLPFVKLLYKKLHAKLLGDVENGATQ